MLLIAPKGCQQKPELGLLRFLELLAFDDGDTPEDDEFGVEGKVGSHQFLLFLARHYASLLRQLCLRDFRSYYRAEEDQLARLYSWSATHSRIRAVGRFRENRTSCHAVGTSFYGGQLG